ncbi:Saccharopine dehydrogenase-domain-containing protein [Elsinoe ampelina]|uniref:Saccharopine dehydrogenase-domain-containing protein n=1 Tax=Elsinoe ampelina TaxID=302913 RepID=A0A6A6GHD3_9PEZI|nr:Saccharopine dehydrogenase-domain-containing protein [Elsinoe ampelina]
MSQGQRQYDLVVFGATGFTGKYTAEHVATDLPTDVKWAIAGRSTSKLQALVDELKQLNPDRPSPAIEECSLDKQQLDTLAKKTRVLLTTVGPYAKYGTPVLEACVNNGTHYFDVTGETPWVYDMIDKYHEKAKANHAIIIPQIGMDSAPADLLTWSLVTHVQRTLSKTTKQVIFTLHKARSKPSGGTLASLLGLFDTYSLSFVGKALKPWALSPVSPVKTQGRSVSPSLIQKVTGVRSVPDLGTLTTSLQGAVDRTQVYRTWGLLDSGKFYGSSFRFFPYMTARNVFVGMLTHFAIAFGGLALLLSPLRAILKRFVYAPGDGPTRDESKHDYIEYRAIAEADSPDPSDPKRVFGRFAFEGSAYHMTGVFLAQAAISLLRDESLAKELGGGVLTPATLGAGYIERLQKVGFKLELRTLP